MRYVTSWERMAEARLLLKILKSKFGLLPAWVEEKVNSADVVQLEQWAERILTAQSVDSLLENTEDKIFSNDSKVTTSMGSF